MELWDLLDENGNYTGKTIERGSAMQPHEFHLVVHVWISNSKGEYLISKRTPNKHYPGMWEATGGAVKAGEDSLTSALRETEEELGIALSPQNGCLFRRIKRSQRSKPDFCDVWLFQQEVDLNSAIVQEDEVSDAKWARPDEIRKMTADGEFVPVFDYMEELFEFKFKY